MENFFVLGIFAMQYKKLAFVCVLTKFHLPKREGVASKTLK